MIFLVVICLASGYPVLSSESTDCSTLSIESGGLLEIRKPFTFNQSAEKH
jgi:hypothetical protein